jgi:glucokinase
MHPVVAVDLGGTNLRTAFYPQGAPPAERIHRFSLGVERGPQAVVAAIGDAVRGVAPAPFPAGLRVAVAAPGPLDPFKGVVLNAPNLPGWKDIPLRDDLEHLLGLPVRVGNDANLAALAEWQHGAGAGCDHLVYLTISTGIGGGVIVDGRLLVGGHGLAAELGHVPVVDDGPPCSCGRHGHLEAVASGKAIARRAAELLAQNPSSTLGGAGVGPLDAEKVGAAAREGDPLARRVFKEAGEAVGRALAGLLHVFNPQRIILGGGVARAGEVFWEPVRRALKAEVMDPAYLEGVELLPASLGDDAGLVGALVLANLP